MKKNVDCEFNRFDVCAAYAAYSDWYNVNGRTERCIVTGRNIRSQLSDVQYSPGMGGYFEDEGDENAKTILVFLVWRWEGRDAANDVARDLGLGEFTFENTFGERPTYRPVEERNVA